MGTGETWCRMTAYGPDGSTLGHWTLRGTGAPDLAAVDVVARLYRAARSRGGHAELDWVAPALADLLRLAGLELLGDL
jgi:hypothetical protein